MKKYIVRKWHTVWEDDYKEGMLHVVNEYETKEEMTLEEVKEMMSHEWFWYDEELDEYKTSEQQNEAGEEPTGEEIELWKKGEIKLYMADIEVDIYELTKKTDLHI